MQASHVTAQALPLSDLNTTPLIDVLLVLLILFIITIPAATHSVELSLPNGISDAPINPVTNKVMVTSTDQILWNGAAVTQPELGGLLNATSKLPVVPELQFEAEGAARYDLAAQVVRTIKLSGAGTMGMVGNERFAEFGRKN